MNNKTSIKQTRYYNSYLDSFGINYNFLINPWIPTLWSFAFPGFGHLLLGMYIDGYVLMIWEIIVNTKSHLNLAMMYSFTGQFDRVKEITHVKWALLYIPVYVYAAWDSYRSAVDTNKLHVLGEKEQAGIVPYKLSNLSINYLDKVNPRLAALWSMLMPGLGHILLHRMFTGFFILGFWIIICRYSDCVPAIYYTFTGSFQQAVSVLKPEWFLYLPSLYVFAIYDSYLFSVETTKLYKLEQVQFLTKEYQSSRFKIPWKPGESKQ